jgi:hypothetical protein
LEKIISLKNLFSIAISLDYSQRFIGLYLSSNYYALIQGDTYKFLYFYAIGLTEWIFGPCCVPGPAEVVMAPEVQLFAKKDC